MQSSPSFYSHCEVLAFHKRNRKSFEGSHVSDGHILAEGECESIANINRWDLHRRERSLRVVEVHACVEGVEARMIAALGSNHICDFELKAFGLRICNLHAGDFEGRFVDIMLGDARESNVDSDIVLGPDELDTMSLDLQEERDKQHARQEDDQMNPPEALVVPLDLAACGELLLGH